MMWTGRWLNRTLTLGSIMSQVLGCHFMSHWNRADVDMEVPGVGGLSIIVLYQ